MVMTPSWAKCLASFDENEGRKVSQIAVLWYGFSNPPGHRSAWIKTHGLPNFLESGFVKRIPKTNPARYLRTPAGTAALEETAEYYRLQAIEHVRSDFAKHGHKPFFPEDSFSHTFHYQQEAIKRGWLVRDSYPSPKLVVTPDGLAAIAS